MKIKVSIGERIFSVLNHAFLVLLAFLCLFPFVNTVAISFSETSAITAGKVLLVPVGFELSAYKAVFQDSTMIRSMIFTIILTVLFTAIAVLMTVLCAYPLAQKRLKGRKIITVLITFTMYFSGGMIPSYLLVSELNLLNTVWALILPCALNTFNMIIMKSFFMSLPESLSEAAYIDGCNDIGILFKIILPLSMPIIATISLFYAVQRWNGFTDALYYINDSKLYPLQMKLRQLISLNMVDQMIMDSQSEENVAIPESIKSASLMFATVPILMVYPWLQKYFVKGVMVGSVKA